MATCRRMPSTTLPRNVRASSRGASPSSSEVLGNAQIINPVLLDADGRCVFGATVELEDMDSREVVTYQIVGEDEADIKLGKISITSPLARALVGKYAGEVAEVQAPGGLREYEILDAGHVEQGGGRA